jgi:PhzF family phenazine biosynthesis protein
VPVDVQRIAAFAEGETGGNPAGVALLDRLPEAAEMQRVAAGIGYSETAFAAPAPDGWRVRYFAPEVEVAFCGHATIALGAALAWRHGDGLYRLILNEARISVEGRRTGGLVEAALRSPPTRSGPAAPELVSAALSLFGYSSGALDPRIPPAIAEAGVRHLILALSSRADVSAMSYDLAAGRRLMQEAGLVTVSLVHAQTPRLFHARNPFASGGVYEDPATGAAAAALAGYLRDLGWPHGGAIDIVQGEDMGMPSRLRATIPAARGEGIRVSGLARIIPSGG